jgi:hypothetical protein
MDCIYLHEIQQINLLQLLYMGQGGDGGDITKVQCKSTWNCDNEPHHRTANIS